MTAKPMILSPENPPTPRPVDHLLISAGEAVAAKIADRLSACALNWRRGEMGLQLWCDQHRSETLLEILAATLSADEQHDTRIARVLRGATIAELHRAIFRADSLDVLLQRQRNQWFHSVLERNAIKIHFQPLVQHPPGRLHGYECLMRGLDEQNQLIPPTRMFEAARALGKLEMLEERCRHAALREASRCGGDAIYFINFNPRAVSHPKRCLVETMRLLEQGPLQPHQICFEVVETDQAIDRRELLTLLRYFRKAGFKVALDDVGSGYSTLLSLSYLRPDYIKIDGELVRRSAVSGLEAKMVADLAETARQNGIITIAEGIETEAQMKSVQSAGIRILQGYYFARPAPQVLSRTQVSELLRQKLERASSPAA